MSKDRIQQEALELVRAYKRCGLGITMGGGKTVIGLKHMAERFEPGKRFLVVAPKRSIFKSWEAAANEFGLAHLVPFIDFSTYLSLHKQSLNYKVVYLDECHSLLPSHGSWLQQFEGMILGLTGTPPRFERTGRAEMIERFCPIVYTYVTDEAVADGILNDYRIIVHHLKLDVRNTVQVTNRKTGQRWYTSEWESYRYWEDRIESGKGLITLKDKEWMRLQRMRVLMGFPSKVCYTQELLGRTAGKTIVFANTQQQAEDICKNSYHASNPKSRDNLELFVKGTISCLSTVAQLNEGVSIPDLKEGIILHAYSNERKTAQRIGRLLRLNLDEVATAHVLCYDGTIDENWVQAAVHDFNEEKIFHYYPWKRKLFNCYGEQLEARTELPDGCADWIPSSI